MAPNLLKRKKLGGSEKKFGERRSFPFLLTKERGRQLHFYFFPFPHASWAEEKHTLSQPTVEKGKKKKKSGSSLFMVGKEKGRLNHFWLACNRDYQKGKEEAAHFTLDCDQSSKEGGRRKDAL